MEKLNTKEYDEFWQIRVREHIAKNAGRSVALIPTILPLAGAEKAASYAKISADRVVAVTGKLSTTVHTAVTNFLTGKDLTTCSRIVENLSSLLIRALSAPDKANARIAAITGGIASYVKAVKRAGENRVAPHEPGEKSFGRYTYGIFVHALPTLFEATEPSNEPAPSFLKPNALKRGSQHAALKSAEWALNRVVRDDARIVKAHFRKLLKRAALGVNVAKELRKLKVSPKSGKNEGVKKALHKYGITHLDSFLDNPLADPNVLVGQSLRDFFHKYIGVLKDCLSDMVGQPLSSAFWHHAIPMVTATIKGSEEAGHHMEQACKAMAAYLRTNEGQQSSVAKAIHSLKQPYQQLMQSDGSNLAPLLTLTQ